MKLTRLCARLFAGAAFTALAASSMAQDIKLGFNGDLSASPSAQSGHAAVLGKQDGGLGRRFSHVQALFAIVRWQF